MYKIVMLDEIGGWVEMSELRYDNELAAVNAIVDQMREMYDQSGVAEFPASKVVEA